MNDIYAGANPKGYHSVTPSITVGGGADAIAFYERAFGGKVRRRMDMPDGRVMHAEIEFGDSVVLVHDEFPDWGSLGPLSIGGSPSSLQLYVADADAIFAQALAAGAEADQPMSQQFWGDRMGRVKDPFGHYWTIATRVEPVTPEEIDRRAQEWLSKSAC